MKLRNRLSLSNQIKHVGVALVPIVPDKRSHGVFRADRFIDFLHFEELFVSTRSAGAFPLLLHQVAVTVHIDDQPSFLCHFPSDFDREPQSIVKPEGVVCGDPLGMSRQSVEHRHPLLQGFQEFFFF